MEVENDQVMNLGGGQYLIRSRTTEGWHCVDLGSVDGHRLGGCTCKGFQVRKHCWHLDLAVTLEAMDRGRRACSNTN